MVIDSFTMAQSLIVIQALFNPRPEQLSYQFVMSVTPEGNKCNTVDQRATKCNNHTKISREIPLWVSKESRLY